MDVLTENIEKDPPWAMMFADDLVLCAMTREEVEEDQETGRVVFERHGLKISRTKTEYLPSSTNDTETTVKIVDAELPTVTSFKYLGSIFTSEGGSQADVNNTGMWEVQSDLRGTFCGGPGGRPADSFWKLHRLWCILVTFCTTLISKFNNFFIYNFYLDSNEILGYHRVVGTFVTLTANWLCPRKSVVGTCHQIAIAGNEKQFADDATFDIFSDWMTRSAYFCATFK